MIFWLRKTIHPKTFYVCLKNVICCLSVWWKHEHYSYLVNNNKILALILRKHLLFGSLFMLIIGYKTYFNTLNEFIIRWIITCFCFIRKCWPSFTSIKMNAFLWLVLLRSTFINWVFRKSDNVKRNTHRRNLPNQSTHIMITYNISSLNSTKV